VGGLRLLLRVHSHSMSTRSSDDLDFGIFLFFSLNAIRLVSYIIALRFIQRCLLLPLPQSSSVSAMVTDISFLVVLHIYPALEPPRQTPPHHNRRTTQNQENHVPSTCVINSPNLFFNTTLCLEYLSSGLNLAGCADFVTTPSNTFFRV
jgi:hypothetical protein